MGEEGHAGWRNDLGGVVQGHAIQAQSIRDVHLNVTPATSVPIPRQLPLPPPHFTGRSSELSELDRLASASGETGGITVVVIVAAGGVGKTTLASHWLHRIGGQYEGGALFADLRGHDPANAADPGGVAAGFLRVLGVPPERIPLEDAAEQSALLRSVTAGRRMLVLLNNAASAAQVRLLLPGPGPGPDAPSLVVVTTRWRIAGLVIEGARFMELGPLEEPAALDLFDRMVGSGRAAAEPDERDTIVRLADGHPLAICITAARLAARPRWRLSRLAAELSSEQTRLRAMSLEGDVSVRAAFDVAYQTLEPDMKRAYRMTAVIPGPSFDAELAGAALGTSDDEANDLLDALTDACLLAYAPDDDTQDDDTPDDGSRYQFHDLARLHARELATQEELETVIARSVDWYLERAVAADSVASPGRWRLNPMYETARASPPAYPDATAALDWLESRLPGLLATVESAHEEGLHQQTWQLCEALWNVFVVRKHFREWISAHRVGLAAARSCGDTRAQAQMHNQLGFALLTLQRFGEAREHFLPALELSRRDGHDLGMATALERIGLVDLTEDAPDSAIARFAEFREILSRLGRQRGVAIATRRIGEANRDLGRYDDALRELSEARRIFADLSELYLETRTLTSIAQTLLLAGRATEAIAPLKDALATAARLGSRYEQARIARYLGQTAAALGDIPAARRYLSDALAGFEVTAAPDADEVRGELASLGGTEPAPPDTTTT